MPPPLTARLARLRVPLGFASGAVALWLARPSPATLVTGAVVAIMGEGLRLWAAGHLAKEREVTASGPYRWMRHPLYAGSSIMGVGVAIATASLWVAALVVTYLTVAMTAAIRSEESSLRRIHGEEYDAYRNGLVRPARRRFSIERVRANREYRAIAGLVVAMGLLVIKMWWGSPSS